MLEAGANCAQITSGAGVGLIPEPVLERVDEQGDRRQPFGEIMGDLPGELLETVIRFLEGRDLPAQLGFLDRELAELARAALRGLSPRSSPGSAPTAPTSPTSLLDFIESPILDARA